MNASNQSGHLLCRKARGYSHDAGWTEDRVETLRKLWADGLSCSEIASEMGGGLTHNAVIGKVHRVGLPGRVKPAAKARQYERSDKPRRAPSPKPATKTVMRAVPVFRANGGISYRMKPKTVLADEPVVDRTPIEIGQAAVTIFDAKPCQCRWPYGDPRDLETFRFCGEPIAPDHSYCAPHQRQSRGQQ